MVESWASLTSRPIGDDLLIHDQQGRRVLLLNATARKVWEMVSANRSVDEIIEAIRLAHPDVDSLTAKADVERCLAEFGELGLRSC